MEKVIGAISVPWLIAKRYLRSKRKEVFISIITVISLLGVAVSVMVLDIVLAVMSGFEEELQSKLIDANAHVSIKSLDAPMKHYQDYLDAVKKDPGVNSAQPFTYSQAMIQTSQGARGIIVRGISKGEAQAEKLAGQLTHAEDIERLFKRATLSAQNNGREIQLPTLFIGEELRRRLGVLEGSVVTLLSPELGSSPLGLVPRHRRFVIAGVYSSGLVEYEAGLAYASIEETQKFFDFGQGVSGIDISVKDRNRVIEVASRLKQILHPMALDYDESLSISDWTEHNRPLWDAIKLEKRVYFIVLLLLVLVASFSIVATLVMVVMEKSKDIAVLKTMGMSDSEVLRIFLYQGGLIGVLGVLLGSVLGFLGCLGLKTFGFPIDARVFSMDTVPVHLDLQNFLVVAVCGLLITSLAGLYPARRAARIVPAEVLRFE